MIARTDDKSGTEILDRDACLKLLIDHQYGVGRVGFVEFTEPVILPVNYIMDEGRIAFRTATGSKFEAAMNAKKVAFEIDAVDSADNAWSVLVRGRADVVRSTKHLTRLDGAGLQSWTSSDKSNWVAIWPTGITGRRIPLPAEPR